MQQSATQGSIAKFIVHKSFFMALGLLTVLSSSLVDSLFIAQLGEEQLAGISFTSPITLLIISFAMGIGGALHVIISPKIGANKFDETKQIITNVLLFTLAFICFISFIGINTIKPIFSFLGADYQALNYIEQYMKIWYLGMPFLIIPMVSNYDGGHKDRSYHLNMLQ